MSRFLKRPLKIDCYILIEQSVDYWAALHYSNRVVMHCNEVSFQGLMDCPDNDLENNFENNA